MASTDRRLRAHCGSIYIEKIRLTTYFVKPNFKHDSVPSVALQSSRMHFVTTYIYFRVHRRRSSQSCYVKELPDINSQLWRSDTFTCCNVPNLVLFAVGGPYTIGMEHAGNFVALVDYYRRLRRLLVSRLFDFSCGA